MFFFINNLISAIVWLLIAYLFNFSVIGWIVGLVVSYIFHEFIGPLLIVKSGDKYFDNK